MENRPGEIKEVTLLQSIGIFLVVFGHSYVEMNQHPGDPVLSSFYWLHNFIYSFHMPLFMFISGLLFANKNYGQPGLDYAKYVSSRFKRLLVPYIVISTLTFPIKAVLSKFAVRPVDLSLIAYIKSIIYPFSNPIFFYWFLPTLFAVSLLAPILVRLIQGKNRAFFLVAITAALIALNIYNPFHSLLFNIKGIAGYLIYFWSGCVFWVVKDKICSVLRSVPIAAGLLSLLVGINLLGYSNPKLAILAAFTGILLALCAAYKFTETGHGILGPINGYSYQIYLLSWFPQIFAKILLYDILHLGFYVSFVFMLLGGLFVPLIVTRWARNSAPKLNILIGLK
jgi:fucose 4-O-acetylase-like acetyltransferase